MRCARIKFFGFKRLADTGCNVDGKIIAFVGLNEAGKSSLLEGLVRLTGGNSKPLPVTAINRSSELDDKTTVISANYALDQTDLDLLADLDLACPPTTYTVERWRDGTQATGFVPWLSRNPAPFVEARSRLDAARERLSAQFDAAEADSDTDLPDAPSDWAAAVDTALSKPDEDWSAETQDAAQKLVKWLAAVPSTNRSKPRDGRAADALSAAHTIATTAHPNEVGRQRMAGRVPRFVLFADEDRALATTHAIAEVAQREDLQPSLRNLLGIAKLDVNRLWRYIETEDDSSQESYIDEANENLEHFFRQAWNQANVTVRLKVDARRLEIRLKELTPKGAVTNIEERSDGLRTFIALAAFLAAQRLRTPPILLIDEAETHLHYDAQADLVGVLLKNVEATQVFYTTHSPGCLPTDLGTSIRLLSKNPAQRDASTLKADFWTNQEPGFAPLLYAMGASAAAFSVCRRAVLAEGPADMVLLPTLIRLATAKADLDYQIAPGLTNAHAYEMKVEEVAAKVVYLADGDTGGDKHETALLEAGVSESRIFRLPPNTATEDLIEAQQYVEIINEILPTDTVVKIFELDDGQPIAKSFQDWGKRNGVKTPGHVAVAYAILRRGSNIRLTNSGKKHLRKLDTQFVSAFSKAE